MPLKCDFLGSGLFRKSLTITATIGVVQDATIFITTKHAQYSNLPLPIKTSGRHPVPMVCC
jgi:hypothetical protein